MKKVTISLILSFVAIFASNSQSNFKVTDDKSVLELYQLYSEFTNPGKYEYLYKNLPDSLPELCKIIKAQSIHPYAELPKYRDQIPKEKWNWFGTFPTVESILEGLQSYDSTGFNPDRKLEDRLVLICQHNSLLFASVLKYRGIPVRVRYGHARYLIPDFHTSHVICEVWNKSEKRWMLVDPTIGMIDFDPQKFDFSNDTWLQLQKGEIDPEKYGIPGRYTGALSIAGKLPTDMAAILGTEYPVDKYAPMMDDAYKNENQLSDEHIELLNKVSKLMSSLDAENITQLQDIYTRYPEIQLTKTFDPTAVKNHKKK